MRAFYAAGEPLEIVPQAVGQLRKAKMQQPVAAIVLQPVSKWTDVPPEPFSLLPWSTNLILLHNLRGSLPTVEGIERELAQPGKRKRPK